MHTFRDTRNSCDLDDLGYHGDILTWRRGHIRKRLDSDIATHDWVDMFPMYGGES